MRFFTREWSEGALDDPAAERIAEQYADHLAELWDLLPSTVRHFVDEVDLHDGLTRRVQFDDGTRELVVEFRTGDEQDGFFDVALRYVDAEISAADLERLRTTQSNPDREILSDELDTAGPARFAHRVLFAADGEIEVTFETLRAVKVPSSSSKA